ncbi:hypothetical protein ACMU_01330 [Actibacterium mucosum KCTC 23349]|uniref:DUF3306 domain-containing protein n=1 Tax=Actibacterium mucosum KCTC 23349 TaxID=1454373 RepID=A0A037ZM36_9RHOB|nr:DUF3306 domain-containing protein [Actibacterium mucosum]KAJ57164.1 hypothetical protein ACMU_01330 [Actibacterium mucosum KCTC 23349]
MSRDDFWSRRREAVAEEARAEQAALDAAEVEAAEDALAKRSDEELLAEAGLPEPETLENAEEVRDFLKAALPQRLKSRALRRLWGLNPVLANLDGLVDYGEDFTDAATVIDNLQTVYQVGKGMVTRLEEIVEDMNDAPSDESGEKDGEIQDTIETPDPEPLIAQTDPPIADPDEPVALATPRRMAFRFEATEGPA